jgi:hypothetical protein
MDVWYDIGLAKRQDRKYIVLPVELAERILTAANWPKGPTTPPGERDEFDSDEITDNV